MVQLSISIELCSNIFIFIPVYPKDSIKYKHHQAKNYWSPIIDVDNKKGYNTLRPQYTVFMVGKELLSSR